MTTEQAEIMYLNQHLEDCKDLKNVIYNPHNIKYDKLPFIYGFNNGFRESFFEAFLLSEDGICLGGHACSNESYMPWDLAIINPNSDRHNAFKKHYPNGYRMIFIPSNDVKNNTGLQEAISNFEKKQQELKNDNT